MPLNLLTFRGSSQNNSTLLDWETANEINTSQFIIERSIDGRNFSRIGAVAAAGTSNINNKYSFTDYNVADHSSSILYYRLKMVDKDGAFTYSKVVMISLPFITGRVSVFPNPSSHEVNVTITTSTEGKVQLNLVDNTGRVVLQNSTWVKRGNNSFDMNIRNLSTGFYYLNVTGTGLDQKVKLEKL